jgi:DNA-binding transcriptional LysR family regulator
MTPDSGTLTQLRAFESVGRNLSFTKAASELFVTPAALSHHVRHLESSLGVPLVRRLHRRIELTPAGELLLAEATVSLRALGRALEVVGRTERDAPLIISVAPYFSARWLTPRLGRFWARSPDTRLQLQHAYHPANFLTDDVAAGINWCPEDVPGSDSTLILHGRLTMVCRPDFLDRLSADPQPSDLLRHRLYYEFDVNHLHDWFAAAGEPTGDFRNADKVDDSHTLRELVVTGNGAGLFFSGLIHEDVRSGLLVAPFEVEVDPGSAYYLLRPRGRGLSPRLEAFIEWLQQETLMDPLD